VTINASAASDYFAIPYSMSPFLFWSLKALQQRSSMKDAYVFTIKWMRVYCYLLSHEPESLAVVDGSQQTSA
jgi:hypothetical protein